jgi:hypothetical protein
MHLLSFILFFFLSLFQIVSAQLPGGGNTSVSFYLRSVVISDPKQYGNLYPWGYHAGAGYAAIVMLPTKNGSLKNYFNGTRLNTNRSTSFPWGWQPGYSNGGYSSWDAMGINAGIGWEGYSGKDGEVSWGKESWIGTWFPVINKAGSRELTED